MKKGTYAGIDIGGTNVKLALTDSSGSVILSRSIPTDAAKGPRDAFERIAAALADLGAGREVRAAGVACAGLFDRASGRLHSSPNLLAWENAPLARIARSRLGVYTVVDNDANAAAYGEYFRGCGRGRGTLICITLGTGVGGGIVIDGRPLRGSRNFAGEVGHATICASGPRCHCGSRGCLEAYVGSYGLVREARAKLRRRKSRYLSRWVGEGRRMTPKLIAEAAARGDRAAREVFEEAGVHLGTALANLINIFNPDLIAIAGGVAQGFHLMRPRLEEEVRRRAFPESRRAAKIVQARLGTEAAAVGAALLARDTARDATGMPPSRTP
jgi:glucokinase